MFLRSSGLLARGRAQPALRGIYVDSLSFRELESLPLAPGATKPPRKHQLRDHIGTPLRSPSLVRQPRAE